MTSRTTRSAVSAPSETPKVATKAGGSTAAPSQGKDKLSMGVDAVPRETYDQLLADYHLVTARASQLEQENKRLHDLLTSLQKDHNSFKQSTSDRLDALESSNSSAFDGVVQLEGRVDGVQRDMQQMKDSVDQLQRDLVSARQRLPDEAARRKEQAMRQVRVEMPAGMSPTAALQLASSIVSHAGRFTMSSIKQARVVFEGKPEANSSSSSGTPRPRPMVVQVELHDAADRLAVLRGKRNLRTEESFRTARIKEQLTPEELRLRRTYWRLHKAQLLELQQQRVVQWREGVPLKWRSASNPGERGRLVPIFPSPTATEIAATAADRSDAVAA